MNELPSFTNKTNLTSRVLLIQPYASAVGGVDSVLLQLITLARRADSRFRFSIVLPPGSPYITQYRNEGVSVFEVDLSVFSVTAKSAEKLIEGLV